MTVTVNCDKSEAPVVHTALELLQRDYRAVFSDSLHCEETRGNILVGTLEVNNAVEQSKADLSGLKGMREAFLLTVLPDGRLLIAGSDSHGTAYGIMELSRLIGVSPWKWWADATPMKRNLLSCLPVIGMYRLRPWSIGVSLSTMRTGG